MKRSFSAPKGSPSNRTRKSRGSTGQAPPSFHEYDLPAFPVDSLPEWLRLYVEAEARATQTPADLTAKLALAICGAACAKKVFVLVRQDWKEPVNIFTATALPPAHRKSRVFKDTAAPLGEREEELTRERAAEITDAENHLKILEGRLRHLQQDASKAKPAERIKKQAEAGAVARELAETKVPAYPRLIADDCSVERLATLLRDQSRRRPYSRWRVTCSI